MAKTHLIIPTLTAEKVALFRSHIAPPNADGCELWMAGCSNKGYGKFDICQETFLAHRVAYFLYTGEQPNELQVCHNCDIRNCLAEAHLFLGTQADNMADAVKKGRMATGDRNATHLYPERLHRGDAHHARRHPEWRPRGDKHGLRLHPERAARGKQNGKYTRPEQTPRGEQHGNAKLTDDKVREILALKGIKPQRTVAAMFGVGKTTIAAIWHRRLWTHVN